MRQMYLFGAMNTALLGFGWLVHLAGAVVALVFVIRRRGAASILALIGFGLPVLLIPILTALQYLLPQRMGPVEAAVQTMQGIGVLQNLVGIVSVGCLGIALWLALRGDQPA